MNKIWHHDAWQDYLYWQFQDKRTLKRINKLLDDIDRNRFVGIGKPERLSGDLSEYWSRRIDEKNRIVYKIEDNELIIIQCGSHYKDK